MRRQDTIPGQRPVARVKAVALAAWVPVAAGAILATYGQSTLNAIGVALWAGGVVLQLTTLVVHRRLRGSGRPEEPGVSHP